MEAVLEMSVRMPWPTGFMVVCHYFQRYTYLKNKVDSYWDHHFPKLIREYFEIIYDGGCWKVLTERIT